MSLMNPPAYADVREALLAGMYDDDLKNLSAAINERMAIRRSFVDFGVGDRVVLNDTCGTKYLRGATATVVETMRKNVKIVLDKPTGRFLRYNADGSVAEVKIRVPTSIIDPL